MRKIYFQGSFGAYSHLAALEIDAKAEVIPCKTFDECFLKTSLDKNSRIVIPESIFGVLAALGLYGVRDAVGKK